MLGDKRPKLTLKTDMININLIYKPLISNQ